MTSSVLPARSSNVTVWLKPVAHENEGSQDGQAAPVAAPSQPVASEVQREASRFRRAVDDHVRYSVSATVASGSIEIQQMLLARALVPTR